jgi:hypothetical protein
VIDLLIPWLLVIGLLYPMRRLEGWLHQHMFKVGWLATKDFSTTTVLYYSLFLPGVALHEFTRWLVAGMLNVRAERAIRWPEKQEIGELHLDFVRLAKNTSAFKLAIISLAPLLVGMGIISFIANNVLLLDGVMAAIYGETNDWGAAISRLLTTPDLWLWAYIILAISNTMMPEWKNLRGWRPILIALVIVIVALYLIGTGDVVLMALLGGPFANTLNTLALTFTVIIGIDLLATGILGGIESLIERITGDSATFQNGKLVAMRREEVIKLRQQQQEKEQKQQAKTRALPSGAPSIYRFPLPVPPAPGREAAPIVVAREQPASLPSPSSGPGVITIEKPPTPQAAPPATASPGGTSAVPASPIPAPPNPPQPAISRPAFNPPPASKPALPPLDDEEEEDEAASPATGSPIVSSPAPASTVSKTLVLSLDDDEDEDEELP